MRSFILMILIAMFVGCGSSDGGKKDEDLVQEPLVNTSNVAKLEAPNESSESDKKSEDIAQESLNKTSATKKSQEARKISRTLTIYIHGYDPKGEKFHGVVGDDIRSQALDQIADVSGFSLGDDYNSSGDVNIVVTTEYYGDVTPDYYTPQDEEELEATTKGIPRYALIVAKFANHMMSETNTTKLNIVSASMGSLIARYLIEKDLEHLASQKKIQKWLSLEGVIAGNIAASDDILLSLVDAYKDQPTEVKQMRYSWIKKEFGSNYTTNSDLMKDIDIAFESSTNDHLNQQAITKLKGKANDGVQAVRDTYFHNDYMHTYFYQTHTSLEDIKAPWAYAVIFLTSKRRVKITLTKAKLANLHEDDVKLIGDILPAEVVFESRVFSQKAMDRWGFDYPIDERVYKSHYLDLYKYKRTNELKDLDQVIFDSRVLDDEKELTIKIRPYEIDLDSLYGVYEPYTGHGDKESLQEAKVTIPLKRGEYKIESREWSGVLKVEVF